MRVPEIHCLWTDNGRRSSGKSAARGILVAHQNGNALRVRRLAISSRTKSPGMSSRRLPFSGDRLHRSPITARAHCTGRFYLITAAKSSPPDRRVRTCVLCRSGRSGCEQPPGIPLLFAAIADNTPDMQPIVSVTCRANRSRMPGSSGGGRFDGQAASATPQTTTSSRTRSVRTSNATRFCWIAPRNVRRSDCALRSSTDRNERRLVLVLSEPPTPQVRQARGRARVSKGKPIFRFASASRAVEVAQLFISWRNGSTWQPPTSVCRAVAESVRRRAVSGWPEFPKPRRRSERPGRRTGVMLATAVGTIAQRCWCHRRRACRHRRRVGRAACVEHVPTAERTGAIGDEHGTRTAGDWHEWSVRSRIPAGEGAGDRSAGCPRGRRLRPARHGSLSAHTERQQGIDVAIQLHLQSTIDRRRSDLGN
jgi:hypothetical protein